MTTITAETAESSHLNHQENEKVPVCFYTTSSAFVLSERPILVPVTSTPAELSDLVRHLILADGEDLAASVSFNFLFESSANVKVLLRGQLKNMLLETGWTLERTVRLEYVESTPEPQLQQIIDHPDWIKSITSNGSLVATGCYDGSVRIFSRVGAVNSTLQNHSQSVSGVAFIPSSSASSNTRLVSVSTDQTGKSMHQNATSSFDLTFTLNNFYNSPETAEPFSALAVSRKGDWIAAGSAEGKIAVYSGRREEPLDDISSSATLSASEPSKKKSRKTTNAPAPAAIVHRKSRFVLEGAHSSTVTSLIFDRTENKSSGVPLLFSASLDGSIRAWDLSEQSFAFILSCDSPVTATAHHPTNAKLILSAHPDGSVRLWDISEPLISSSALQPTTYFAGNPEIMKKHLKGLHKGWITSIAWSPRDENIFATAGHDGALHIWDIRSPASAPESQYTLRSGNGLKDGLTEQSAGKILALDWSIDGHLRCGGEDCKLSIYSTK